MADGPRSVSEHAHDQQHHSSESSCPFCIITATYQPITPLDTLHRDWEPERLSPPTYVVLSTRHVAAFLDIAPLTRGHVLVTPRKHRVRIGDLTSSEAAEIGRVLPLVARSVLSAAYPDIPVKEADYNIVQNNGPGAAQVIPHVHFHIIPRPPLDYKPPDIAGSSSGGYATAKIPTGLKASYIQFGRGQRHELDDDDACVLVKQIRDDIKLGWAREFGSVDEPERKEQKL